MLKRIVHLGSEVKSYFGVLDEDGNVLQPSTVNEAGATVLLCADEYRLGSLDDAAFAQLQSLILASRDKFEAALCQDAPPGAETAPETGESVDMTPLLKNRKLRKP